MSEDKTSKPQLEELPVSMEDERPKRTGPDRPATQPAAESVRADRASPPPDDDASPEPEAVLGDPDEVPPTEPADPEEVAEELQLSRDAGRKTKPPRRDSLAVAPEDLGRRFLKDAAEGKGEP